mgnify:CR=1 FL=1
MATKPIPAGTVNLSVNIAKDFRDQIGRHCFKLDRSIGDWAREIFDRALRVAKSAVDFRTEARRAADEDRLAMQLLKRAIASNGGIGPEDTEDVLNALEFISRSATRDQKLSEAAA